MASCETCGNSYDKAFQVVMNGKSHTFDSFECAIFALAPTSSVERASSVMASKRPAPSTAATIALKTTGSAGCATVFDTAMSLQRG
ncbi:hypothetical protein [Bradyrhizobium sp. AUGA SZCCT0182]|uniref:hypothetical protein n=1 Tax=Bradyrhizobium sp. AUGA SZCCT0182 TaxID=2807667 RepID=UPI002011C9B5|nr:hypothetical protein [Bradyrhizobium sp. AUGA SZCCT0182]